MEVSTAELPQSCELHLQDFPETDCPWLPSHYFLPRWTFLLQACSFSLSLKPAVYALQVRQAFLCAFFFLALLLKNVSLS